MRKIFPWPVRPLQITLVYLVMGLIALFVSDYLLLYFFEGSTLKQVQAFKGIVEVLLTALLIYVLLKMAWGEISLKSQALNESPIGITILDGSTDDKSIVYANDRFQDLTGYDPGEVQDSSLDILFGEDSNPESVDALHDAMERNNEISQTVVSYSNDNEKFWDRIKVSPLNYEGQDYLLAYHLDVTKRKQVERDLRESKERFQQVANNIDEIVFIADAELNEAYFVNSAYEDFLNRSAETFLNDDPMDFINAVHPDDRELLKQKMNAVFNGNDVDFEVRYQKNDKIGWFWVEGKPVKNVDGNVKRIVGTARDITDRKKAQDELEKALEEKDQLIEQKNTLLQEVHHRVKNNLQVLHGLVGLQNRRVDNEEAREALRKTKERIISMSMIHEQLYQVSNPEDIRFDEYVETLCDHLLESYVPRDERVKVETDIEERVLDLDTLIPCGLIINELVSNTLEHAFEDFDDAKITITFSEHDHQFELLVADNGRGIDLEEDVEGLGLRLVRTLAEDQLKGEIKSYGEDGHRVRVTFPVDPEKARD